MLHKIRLQNLFLGTLLASASDDLQIILWDWAQNQAAVAYESDHHSNVFQVNLQSSRILLLKQSLLSGEIHPILR